VIFSGSGNRPARNTAEVGLYFLDNSENRTAACCFNIRRNPGQPAESSGIRLVYRHSTGKEAGQGVAKTALRLTPPPVPFAFNGGQGRIGELIQGQAPARRQFSKRRQGISGAAFTSS